MGGEFIRPVIVRTQTNQELRTLLTLRQNLVGQKINLENNISGCLKPFGLIVPRGGVKSSTFEERVYEAVRKGEDRGIHLRDAMTASLKAYDQICQQVAQLSKQIEAAVKKNPICRRLMTAPGVGPVIALSFMTAMDSPKRFSTDDDIGAYFGLTPKQYQSGETDIRTGISKMGNSMTRSHLVQAATVILIKCKKWSNLRAWGMKIAKRRGFQKARIAVARKLAIILHRMWIHETDFRWGNASDKELAAVAAAA
jgi:transposase